ncbi:MAG: hypothetical protein ACOVOQ_11520 [Flavobacterium sp.]
MDRFQVQISKYTDDEKEDLNPAVFSPSRINGVLLQNQQQRYTETARKRRKSEYSFTQKPLPFEIPLRLKESRSTLKITLKSTGFLLIFQIIFIAKGIKKL